MKKVCYSIVGTAEDITLNENHLWNNRAKHRWFEGSSSKSYTSMNLRKPRKCKQVCTSRKMDSSKYEGFSIHATPLEKGESISNSSAYSTPRTLLKDVACRLFQA